MTSRFGPGNQTVDSYDTTVDNTLIWVNLSASDILIASRVAGDAFDRLRILADGTIQWLNPTTGAVIDTLDVAGLAEKVDKSAFDANSILKADADDTPIALAVAASRIVGRGASGGIDDLTPAEVKTILALVAADVSDFSAAAVAATLPSGDEMTFWQDRAALLDPDAYVWVTGANTVVGPVPAGKRWYSVNHWGVLSSLTRQETGVGITSGLATITGAGLTAADKGLLITGPGITAASSRFLVAAGAGTGTLSVNASATNANATVTLYSTKYLREAYGEPERALLLPAGHTETICPFGGYMYVCKPELVIPAPYGSGSDTRYVDNPRALYYERLARMSELTLYTASGVVAPDEAASTSPAIAFPADFSDGLCVLTDAMNLSWVGLDSGSGTLNLWNEISDHHQQRQAVRVLVPFKRTTFPNMRITGASVPGDATTATGRGYGGSTIFTGEGNVMYHKLPGDW